MSASDENDPPKAKPAHPRGIFERRAGSGVWWVRYHDEDGREHREKVGPKALALKVYQKRKNQIAERRYFPETIRRREVSLADMIDDFLARQKDRLRSYRGYERMGKDWKAELPGRSLRQVMPGDIERYVARRIPDVQPATINRHLAFLKRVYSVAIADGKAEQNPVKAVKLLKENNARTRFLSEDEQSKLFEELQPDEQPLVLVALHTGLRRGEQFTLRWEYVDLARRILTVPRSKSGELRRVPLNDEVLELLRGLPSRLKSPWVFPSTTGETPMDAQNFYNRVFVPALERAGIEDFHWHDLRHTFGSRLAMAGVDLRTLQEVMGHKTLAMTLRYAHLSETHQLEAVQRLNPKPTGTATGTATNVVELNTKPPKGIEPSTYRLRIGCSAS